MKSQATGSRPSFSNINNTKIQNMAETYPINLGFLAPILLHTYIYIYIYREREREREREGRAG